MSLSAATKGKIFEPEFKKWDISGSQGDECEDYCLLGYCAQQFGRN
jgi:hypothetical protein